VARAAGNVATIVQGVNKLPGQADLLVELAEGQQPRITGDLSRRGLYHNGLGSEKIEGKLKNRLLTLDTFAGFLNNPG